jgi:hypothetical protein
LKSLKRAGVFGDLYQRSLNDALAGEGTLEQASIGKPGGADPNRRRPDVGNGNLSIA